MAHVAHVDREFLGVFRDLHVLLRQHERALLAVEREHRDAVAHGQHQRGLRAVDAVAGRHLLGCRPAGSRLPARRAWPSGFFSTLKMVPMLTLTSMLLRAVERVEQQQVFALRIAVGHHVDAVHFLAGHGRQVAAPFVGFDQHLVGDDVELLLHLALHVLAARPCRARRRARPC